MDIKPLDSQFQTFNKVTPPAGQAPSPSPSEDTYVSMAERQTNLYQLLSKQFFAFLTKIPPIKNFILFCYGFGLKALRPKRPSKTDLLFFSKLRIPSWFTDEMQLRAAITLKEELTHELEMLKEQAPANCATLARLSQLCISPALYSHPEILAQLEEALATTTLRLITRIHEAHPSEPLQLHLGGQAYEPIETRPKLSGLFVKAFAQCLKNHPDAIPLRLLHVHGPLDNPDALEFLFEGLKGCTSLYHLHLNLDEAASKKAFAHLGEGLQALPHLKFLVFRNEETSNFSPLSEEWESFHDGIKYHLKLESVSLYNLPSPQGFDSIKQTASLTGQGLCIKTNTPLE